MRFVVLLSILVSMTACKKKAAHDGAGSGSGSAAAEPAPPVTATTDASIDAPATGAAMGSAAESAATPTGKLNCDRVLSADLRAKYFPGATITDTTHDKPYEGECRMKQGDDTSDLSVQCDDKVYARMETTIGGIKKLFKDATPVEGVGKAAMRHDSGSVGKKHIGTQVEAWDDDSNCMVTFHVPDTIDPTAFAKDLLATLPPK